MEIKWSLTGAVHEHGQRLDWSEFVARVSEIGGAEPSDLQQLRDLLPESQDDENWRKLVAVIDAGE